MASMDLMSIIFGILVVVFSIVLHEISHGAVAYSLGDNTAKDMGRLTLNPIKHLDFFGSIILPLFTFFLGGFAFGYAKPVPYNPLNLRDRKYGPAKVALAGPAVNIVLALLFGLAFRLLPSSLDATLLPELFKFIIEINLILAIFNLMPIPPLDGHWLVLTLLPDKFNSFKVFLLKYNMFLFVVFIFFIFPWIYQYLIYYLFKAIIGQ